MMCSWHHGVTTSEVIWYHMHVGVVSRRIAWVDMSHSMLMCLMIVVYLMNNCDLMNCTLIEIDGDIWWTLWLCDLVIVVVIVSINLVNCILVINVVEVCELCNNMMINNCCLYWLWYDVKLTLSGRSVDRLPICMNG